MFFDTLIISLCLAGAGAAPYPSENALNAAEARASFPKLGGMKTPV